ncbi:MAG: allantoinase AllB [Sulfobacillus thermotolerans]|nr:allantoinase AllB [Sulfobacillus thermotolerans]
MTCTKMRTIYNAHIVLEDNEMWGHVTIDQGRIQRIGPGNLAKGLVSASYDARGAVVMPAMIDAHVHFNEPGRTHWEGFHQGSRAALAGGVGVIFDMPLNSLPPTTTREALQQKLAAAQAHCRTHFGLWGGVANNGIEQWRALWNAGVMGFKLFMADSGVPEFPAADEETLIAALRFSAESGALIAVHAEDQSVMDGQRRFLENGWRREDYLQVHNPDSEIAAVDRLLYWAERLRAKIHIVHASLADTVVKTFKAKQRGVDVSVETCPHYLTLTDRDYLTRGARYQCAPPLRSAQNVEDLWDCVAKGYVDWIASDHSPSPPGLKTGSDVSKIWGGISGIQSSVEVLLSEGWLKRQIPLPRLSALLSTNVAKRFGLQDRGAIQRGYWADLAIVDSHSDHSLESSTIYDAHRHNPYYGKVLPAQIQATWLNGQIAYAQGEWYDFTPQWIPGPGVLL